MCGASAGQTSIGAAQSTFFTNATNQAQQILGASSSVFKNLMATFLPTVLNGPSQKGFSLGEKSNLDSMAITETGQAYKNEKQAVGESEAAVNGGNVALPGGANIGRDVQLAEAGANQTATELGQINEADYQQGNKNYEAAVAGLEQAPQVFNPATAATNAATDSGKAAAETENQIAQENQSWMQSVSGALGGIAGAAATAYVG